MHFPDQNRRRLLKYASTSALLLLLTYVPVVQANPALLGWFSNALYRLVGVGRYATRGSKAFTKGVKAKGAARLADALVLTSRQSKSAARKMKVGLNNSQARREAVEEVAKKLRSSSEVVISDADSRRVSENFFKILGRSADVVTLVAFANHLNSVDQTTGSMRTHVSECETCRPVVASLFQETQLEPAPLIHTGESMKFNDLPTKPMATQPQKAVYSRPQSMYAW